jgi:Ca2+-binding RTX toxin-like protein
MGRVLAVDPKTGQPIDPQSYVQASDTVFSGAGFNDYFSLDLAGSSLVPYDAVTVWGTKFISLGELSDNEVKFFADNTVASGTIPFQKFPGAFINVGYSTAGNLAAAQETLTVTDNKITGGIDLNSKDYTFKFYGMVNDGAEEIQTTVVVTQNERSTTDFIFQSKGTLSFLCSIVARSYGSHFKLLAGTEGVTIVGSNGDGLYVDNLEIDLAGPKGVIFDAQKGSFKPDEDLFSHKEIIFSGIETFYLKGGVYNDTLYGAAGDDRLVGGAGDDRLFGRAGRDFLRGGLGHDAEFGGAGGDVFRAGGDPGNDQFDGGADFDEIDYSTAKAGLRIDLAAGYAQARAPNDASKTGRDVLSNIELIAGSQFDDIVLGNNAENMLFGYGGNNTLFGAGGRDVLVGGPGNDRLNGGAGSDVLAGLGGRDIFKFAAPSDSTAANPDRIDDFAAGVSKVIDRIDLSAIDAVPGGMDTAFVFGGTKATAHGVWFRKDAAAKLTHVYADTDGNAATAELQIDINGLITLASTHFLL